MVFTAPAAEKANSLLYYAPLDLNGEPLRPPALVSGPAAYLRDPALLAAGARVFAAATDPFARDLLLVELAQDGHVLAPERPVLHTYGMLGFGLEPVQGSLQVLAFDREARLIKPVCPR